MSRRLIVRRQAQQEISEAADWYEARNPGLASDFLRAVDAAVAAVQRSPLQYRIVHDQKRRVLLRRFSYGLIYAITKDEIVILACMHSRRDPKRWQNRQ